MCEPCKLPCETLNRSEVATLTRRLRRCEQLRNVTILLEQSAPQAVAINTPFSIIVTVTNNSAFAVPLQVVSVLEYEINAGDPALIDNFLYTPSVGSVTVHQQSASWSLQLGPNSSATLQIFFSQGAPDDPAVVRSFAYVNSLSDTASVVIGI